MKCVNRIFAPFRLAQDGRHCNSIAFRFRSKARRKEEADEQVGSKSGRRAKRVRKKTAREEEEEEEEAGEGEAGEGEGKKEAEIPVPCVNKIDSVYCRGSLRIRLSFAEENVYAQNPFQSFVIGKTGRQSHIRAIFKASLTRWRERTDQNVIRCRFKREKKEKTLDLGLL